MRMKIRSPTKDKRETFTTEYGTDNQRAYSCTERSLLTNQQSNGSLFLSQIIKERRETHPEICMQNDKTTYKSCFGSLCIAEKRQNNAFRGFGFQKNIWDFLAARFPSSRLWSPQSVQALVYGESLTSWKDMGMTIRARRARESSS